MKLESDVKDLHISGATKKAFLNEHGAIEVKKKKMEKSKVSN